MRVDGSVLGRGSDLRQGVRCEEGVVLGDECFVGAHAEIKAGVKVYPFKTVEAGAIVNSSIVWESRGARSLFGRDGVRGLANVDISPELAVRLSMAWASTFEKGATVTTSRDTSRAARVLKRAIMVGCNAAGVNVDDLEAATVPVTRFQVTSSASMAGVTVRLAPDDPQSVVIRFFDKEGIDVDEATQRKIERLYHREDFRRVLAREIGDIGFPPRSLEHYTAALIELGRPVQRPRRPGSSWCSTTRSGRPASSCPTCWPSSGPRCWWSIPTPTPPACWPSTARPAPARVSELVRASGAHLGAVLDPGGEHMTIVDDHGHLLTDDEALLVLLTLVTEAIPAARVALPVAASRAAEEICRKAGAEIVWTKLSASHLMEVARSEQVTLAASQSGGFIFPALPPRLRRRGHPGQPAGPADRRPGASCPSWWPRCPPVHIAHEAVHTPWDQKGMVMRTLVERSKGRELVLVDGVKVIEDDGWALVLPDPEEPLTHVWAEAGQRRPGRGPGPGVRRPARTAAALTRRRRGRSPGLGAGPPRSGIVRTYERARRSALLRRPRVGPNRRRPGPGRHHRLRPGRAGRRGLRRPARRRARPSRPAGMLGEVESTKSVSEIYAPVAGEVVAVNTALTDAPETAQRRSLRGGLDLRDRPDRPVRGRRHCSTPAATGN